MRSKIPSLLTAMLAVALVLAAGPVAAQGRGPALDKPRPIDAVDTVFIEDMTWMEVRDAIQSGKTTAVVASGGVEQNGPYLVTGKHNVVLRGATEVIARELGNALVAPILKLVPEGDFDPPTGHMRYPGTVGLSQETFQSVLRDVASSLKVHGFQHVVFFGDSGGNQEGMKEVAEELTRKWGGSPVVHFIPEFYDYPGLQKWLETEHGIEQVSEGIHDDFQITAMMMTVDPASVRYEQRVEKGLDSINGVKLSPREKTLALGRAALEWRADRTVEAIRKSISSHPATEPDP